jgi:hypothetical protein
MKKVLIVVFALLLALPAVSFAGSATSRWDLTIGGYVKVDVGWTSQAAGTPAAGLEEYFPDRPDGVNQNVANQSGSFAAAAGQTSLNFLVKGPDTWGAKTTAFVQGNFVGQSTNAGNTGTRYGTFTLLNAYMDFTWPTTKLIVGQNWQSWGFQPTWNAFGLYDLLMAGRGFVVPQITVVQNFSKDFYGSVGIQEPYRSTDQLAGSANLGLSNPANTLSSNAAAGTGGGIIPGVETTRVSTQIPDFTAEFGYKSESCGKIGPNVMQLAVGGFWGQDTVIYADTTTKGAYNTAHVDRWGGAFHGFIPIIPEKNLNKAGSLAVSGSIWTGQNLANWFLGARGIDSLVPYSQSYVNGVATFKVPVSAGGWGQLTYYFTDKVSVNGIYSYNRNAVSNAYQTAYPNQYKQWQQIIGNVVYDVNPAVRVGAEYTLTNGTFDRYGLGTGGSVAPFSEQLGGYTNYAGYLGDHAQCQQIRATFWYFF